MEKEKPIIISASIDADIKKQIAEFAKKNCDGNESMAIRVMLRGFIKNNNETEKNN